MDSMDTSLSKLRETVKDREAGCPAPMEACCSPWDRKELNTTEQEQDDDVAFETLVPQQRLNLGPWQ